MACYNWGEGQVLPLIRSLPANPRDRNFWKLLTKYRDKIPQETYDYVFSIASAAVIGENPRLFGFDFDNPLANLDADAKPANEKKDWLASEIAAARVIELVYGTRHTQQEPIYPRAPLKNLDKLRGYKGLRP